MHTFRLNISWRHFLQGLIIFVFSIITIFPIKAQSYYIINDLKDVWQVYAPRQGGYIPYINSKHFSTSTLSFWLNLKQNRPYQLVLNCPSRTTYLFINNKIQKRLITGRNFFSLDSLYKVHKDSMIFCSIFSKENPPLLKESFIGLKFNTEKTLSKSPTTYPVVYRETYPFKNFVIAFGLFISMCFAFFRISFPGLVQEYTSLKKFFNIMRREETLTMTKPLLSANVLFVLYNLLLISFYYTMLESLSAKNLFYDWKAHNYFSDFVIMFLIVLVGVALIVIGKYILYQAMGYLLGEVQVANLHFYEYLRLSYLYYTIAGGLLAYSHLVFQELNREWIWESFKILTISFHIFRIIVIGVNLNNMSRFRNLYLFAYLCATEILPFLVFLKALF